MHVGSERPLPVGSSATIGVSTVRRNDLSTATWRIALVGFLALGMMVAAGCSADPAGTEPNPTSDGGATTTNSGGAGGAATGGNGSGGSGLCTEDCSLVNTPQCFKSVCNDGQYTGTVGICVVVNDDDGASCDDGQFCTVSDSCLDGVCTGGPQNDCGSAPVACQDVVCDENTQTCSQTPASNGATCTPVDLCEVGGTCTNGLCIGTPNDCFFAPGIGECEEATCNPNDGMCEGSPDPNLDGQACFNEGDLCNDNKFCDNGLCIGGNLKDCSFLDAGCTNGVCAPMTGICGPQQVVMGGVCFDGADQCNTGVCDGMNNCNPAPVANGTVCNDFDSCTSGDVCTSGSCDGTAVQNCTTYFEENFDNQCAVGWTLGGDWECGVPSSGPNAAFSGSNAIATKIAGDYSNSQTFGTAIADTPPINLASATQPLLSFQVWAETEGGPFDGFNVKVSTDGGQNFTQLTVVDPAYNLNVGGEDAWGDGASFNMGYQMFTADLANYAGQQVIIRFDFRTDGSVVDPGVYIDDVRVSEASGIPLVITTSSLPDGYVGFPYAVAMGRSGGSNQATWSIIGGTNHTWLSMSAGGALTGTPQNGDIGAVSVTVQVIEPNNTSNFDQATLNFSVANNGVWIETFEGTCPNGFALGGDWQCGVPSGVGPSAAFSGSQVLGTIIAGAYNNNNAWGVATATSPSISLAGTSTPALSVRLYIDTEGSVYDGANLKISTDGGVNFSLVANVMPAYTLTIDGQQAWGGNQATLGWQEITADLTTYANQNIVLRFDFRTDGSVVDPGVYIDDIVITD
jgi:hypothetical protein